jgi:hypothetical protein
MAGKGALWFFGLLGLAVLITNGITYVRQWLAVPQGGVSLTRDHGAPDSLAYSTLRGELDAIQKRLEFFSQDHELGRKDAQLLQDLSKRLEEVQLQAERLEFRQGREERLLDLAAQVASQSVSTSSGAVDFLSTLFVVVIFGMSLISGLHLKELKEDLEKKRVEADTAIRNMSDESNQARGELIGLRQEMGKVRESGDEQMAKVARSVQESKEQMEVELGRIRSVATNLGQQSAAGGAFLDGLVNIHAEAFSEILSSLPLGRIFSEDEGQRVRLKGQELQGRLLLLHPERERRKKAVMLLGAVGTRIAKVNLRQLQRDPTTDRELALLIESAIRKIDERIEAQKKEQTAGRTGSA